MHIQARTAILGVVFAAAASFSLEQSNPAYIRFTPSATKGALYKPDSGPPPQVGILIIHRTANFMAHLGATELSQRGFLASDSSATFCIRSRSSISTGVAWRGTRQR
jgi:hypothetical protein